MSPLARERAYKYGLLLKYLDRRRKLNENKHTMTRVQYLDKRRMLQNGITRYKKAIKRIDERNIKIEALDAKIKSFMGFSVKGSASNKAKSMNIPRMIFYKWGLENGIGGKYLSQYVEAKDLTTASRGRLRFTRSFTQGSFNKEMWMRFKSHMEYKEAA